LRGVELMDLRVHCSPNSPFVKAKQPHFFRNRRLAFPLLVSIPNRDFSPRIQVRVGAKANFFAANHAKYANKE
jgi:hypothetical protein